MRRRENILANTDWLTVLIFLMLVAFGWMNIYAVNVSKSTAPFASLSNRYTMQLIWISVSIVLAIIIFIIDSRFYSFMAFPFYGFVIFLLLLVLVIGKEVHASRSWFTIGPVAIQPSEFAKAATALVLAKYLSGYNVKPGKLKTIIYSFVFILIPPVLIMLQPDFGSTLVYGALVLVLYREGLPGWVLLLVTFMIALFLVTLLWPKYIVLAALTGIALLILFVLNKKFSHFFYGFLIAFGAFALVMVTKRLGYIPFEYEFVVLISIGIAVVTALIVGLSKKVQNAFLVIGFLLVFIGVVYSVDYVFKEVIAPHQRDRIEVILGKKSDPLGYEYNINQSKIAIGSGGFSGKGFLQGTQTKGSYVPEQSTDFIFCTVGEEWGFLGSFALIFLFVGLLIRLVFIAERQRSRFSRIYGYGVASILFFHFAVNIAMTIELFPVVGIPLPFLSYGGSSLMSFTIMLFILLKLDASRKLYMI